MKTAQSGTALKTLQTEHSAMLDELDKYKLLVESVQDYAIFLLDKDGYIQTWNKGAEKIKGYKPEEIIGKHFSNFYVPVDKESKKPEKELEIATKFGRAEDEDWRVRKDGSRFWASVVITALRDNDGQLVGFAKVTRDLTERKLHEDELRRANVLLKAQQHELEMLSHSKDEFISLASHQLRTPATAIKQLLGLFVDGFVPNVDEQHLRIIKDAYDSNERQIAIVESLLKVAQVDSGKVVLRMSDVDVNKLLGHVLEDFHETFQSRNQSVSFKRGPEAMVIADSQHLRMALENLVSNASKYTHVGGKIRISTASAGLMLKITIKDNGVGIDPADLPNLFEKFNRIPNELSDEVGGTGLGLYWANKVITLHGGRIEVASRPGRGTTFTVLLPMSESNA